jgi:hypothetical protein
MSTGNWFDRMANGTLSIIGAGRPHTSMFGGDLAGRQLGPNGSPYAGVAPSLAGANAGYGGTVQPGANPMAANAPLNPYAAAARQAAGT